MKPQYIDQFLFPYQRPFAAHVRSEAQRVFERIGADAKPLVFLVGIAWPAIPNRHLVCVEPEDGPWPQSLFASSPEGLEAAWKEHPDQQLLYGDEPRMRDKPENIRRRVIVDSLQRDLETASRAAGMRSFVSAPWKIDGYYVSSVIQVPETLLAKFPAVPYQWMGEEHETSFLLACIRTLLEDAASALMLPEPGRFYNGGLRSAEEIVRDAASRFMRTPLIAGEQPYSDLFSEFNAISRVM